MVKKATAKMDTLKMDTLLEPLLLAKGDQQVDDLLSQLITAHAEPVIKGIIRYKLHLRSYVADGRAEAEDLYQEVLVQLLAQLQQLRRQPDENPITDLRGMAAIIAHRTCSRWMRRQFPERHAFKNRLQYLLTRQRGLALWQGADGRLLAGFADWQQTPPQESSGELATRLNALKDRLVDEELLSQIRRLQGGGAQELAAAAAAMFNYLGSPVEFDELVSVLAALLQVSEQPVEAIADNEDAVARHATDGAPDAAWQVEKRLFLQRLWEEVQQLPRNQRAALLLNLKDAEGRGCIALFPATGVAGLRQLAAALEMEAAAFAELWNELPIEDARIAELLGLTRQQVINARKSARERLTRRLKGFL